MIALQQTPIELSYGANDFTLPVEKLVADLCDTKIGPHSCSDLQQLINDRRCRKIRSDFRQGDGELFWYISHGFAAPDGRLAMPGFETTLSSEGRLPAGPGRRCHWP